MKQNFVNTPNCTHMYNLHNSRKPKVTHAENKWQPRDYKNLLYDWAPTLSNPYGNPLSILQFGKLELD